MQLNCCRRIPCSHCQPESFQAATPFKIVTVKSGLRTNTIGAGLSLQTSALRAAALIRGTSGSVSAIFSTQYLWLSDGPMTPRLFLRIQVSAATITELARMSLTSL